MSTTASPPSGAADATPAQFAKLALRKLAEQKLEPTPEHYSKAYAQVAGTQPSPEPTSDDGAPWATLITRLLRGAERGGRQWTTARKKDSLQRVLEGSKNSAQRLHQRLSQLVASWDNDTLDTHLIDSDEDAPAAPQTLPLALWPEIATHTVRHLGEALGTALARSHPATLTSTQEAARALQAALAQSQHPLDNGQALAQAQDDITRSCDQARRIIEHRHHLIDQLTELCQSLTDSLVDLSEDESWVQGQCAAMRHQLDDGLHHRGLRHMQQLLADTRTRQRSLKQERETARQSLKQLIHLMLQELADLGQTTDRFQGNLGRYAETIGQADTLESLAGVVREMIEESHAVQSVVAQAQSRLHEEHTRTTELTERVRVLEDEIRKLSDEVSTDPLTQIANRRGMQRAFEAEQARVARAGTDLSIGLLDVDNFKKLNDQLGHQTGDEALKFLARRVSECLRPVDVVARYGGEEFVVMLPDTAAEAGQQALTRLQRTLSAEFFTHDEHKVFITFSAGVTLYRPGEAIEAALERADVALYEAKRTGKNRTCMG